MDTVETVVAVFDNAVNAEAAVRDLKQAAVPESAISHHANTLVTDAAVPQRGKGFWTDLFGGEPGHDTAAYDRHLQDGSAVVSVRVPEVDVPEVIRILDRHHPVDLDDHAVEHGSTHAAQETGVASAETIQLAEERLSVGKRVLNRGGTRIRRFVVETPFEQQVTLREERVVLDRHPVTDGRPANAAEFSEKTLEMTQASEEPVIEKTARIVEEVALHKETTERVETVRDTVRREQVEVQQLPPESGRSAGRL